MISMFVSEKMTDTRDLGCEGRYVMEATSSFCLRETHLNQGMTPSISFYHVDILSKL